MSKHYQVSLALGCPMSLELFPLDSQICHITLASYGWTDDDVKYNWKVSSQSRSLKKEFEIK